MRYDKQEFSIEILFVLLAITVLREDFDISHLACIFNGPTWRMYEGDPRSNANPSVISSTFGIPKNGILVYYHILSIL